LLFGHKDKRQAELQVDLGDLENEKEHLSSFLKSHLKVSVTASGGNKLRVNSEKLSLQELQHAMTKFVYHRNLNNTHWVSANGTTVKINRFKGKEKKKEKQKKDSLHQTPAQSWGL
jgi:hypothetical protein